MKLLLVEDNPKLNASLKEGLEQDGYAVDPLFDGLSAVKRLGTRPEGYDLMILDIMLPGKDGLEVCKDLREMGLVIPILMLTAKDTTDDKIRGLDAGADDYLVKPFAVEELLARVRALLRRPKGLSPKTLELGPLMLATTQKEAFLSGKRIVLILREFALLEYLMRHPDQIVSREQMIDHIWDHGSDSFSNVIDVHIKNLRKKLGTYGKHLQTVRGLGYKLAV